MAAAEPFAGLPALDALFAADPGRVGQLGIAAAGLHFDWSKTHLTAERVDEFSKRFAEAGLAEKRRDLFAGGLVNESEGRAATHVAERGSGESAAAAQAEAGRRRVLALAQAVEAGAFGEIGAVLHIGIGGSHLGPKLAIDALGRQCRDFAVRFLSNIDGAAFDQAVAGLDPATTLVVAASKTFTTLETRANLDSALDWLRSGGVEDPYGRLIAITAAPGAAVDAGIDETRILTFDEGIGGRYSLWSAVGFPVVLALGAARFAELLGGARQMDEHFLAAEPARNAPLLAAMADRLYVERAAAQSRAVFAYDERLRLLPAYLQQLEMESNGKGVSAGGGGLDRASAPVTWGGVGTDAQHAVFQLLHQGTIPVPVEFVITAEGEDEQDPERHSALILNALAQGAALMAGAAGEEPHRSLPGNRPSSAILVPRLDARALGALIAFYEHRTFANALLIGNNPFDQFGVELGKSLARKLADGDTAGLDPSTLDLMRKAGLE